MIKKKIVTVCQPVCSAERIQSVCVFLAHVDVGVQELGPGVAGQHVDDDHLPPLLHIDQQVTQLPVVLVDQVDALRTNLLKRHDNAASNQLQHSHNGRILSGRRSLIPDVEFMLCMEMTLSRNSKIILQTEQVSTTETLHAVCCYAQK